MFFYKPGVTGITLLAVQICLKFYVSCTIVFLISTIPHLKHTTSGVSLGRCRIAHVEGKKPLGGHAACGVHRMDASGARRRMGVLRYGITLLNSANIASTINIAVINFQCCNGASHERFANSFVCEYS